MRCLHRYPHIHSLYKHPVPGWGRGVLGGVVPTPEELQRWGTGCAWLAAQGARVKSPSTPPGGSPGREGAGPCLGPVAQPRPRLAQPLGGRWRAPTGAGPTLQARGGGAPAWGSGRPWHRRRGQAVRARRFWPEAQAGPTAPPAGLPVQRLQLGPSSLGPESLRVGPVQRSWGLGSGEWRSLGARSPTRPSEKASAESRPPSLASSDPRCCGDRLVVLSMLLVPEWPGFPYQPPPQDTGQEPLTRGQPEGSVRELGAPAPRGGSATCREGAPGSREA